MAQNAINDAVIRFMNRSSLDCSNVRHLPPVVINPALELRWIPRAVHRDLRGSGIDLLRSSGVSGSCTRAEVLVQAVELRRAWNRNDPRLLREEPRQCELSGSASACGNLSRTSTRA